MFKYILTSALSLLFVVKNTNAQAVDHVLGAGFITDPIALEQLSDQRWLVVGRGNRIPGGIYSDTLFYAIFNKEGNLLFRHNIQAPVDEVRYVYGVTATQDGGFVLVVNATECDVSGGKTVMQRYDANGQILWDRQFWPSPSGYFPLYYALAPDGNLIGMFNNAAYKISVFDGSTMWQSLMLLNSNESLWSFTLASGTENLIAATNKGLKYWELTGVSGPNASYTLKNINTPNVSWPLSKILAGPDSVYYAFNQGASNHSLTSFNPLTQAKDTLPIDGTNWIDYTITNNGIWVLYQDVNNIWFKHYTFSGQLISNETRQEPWLRAKFVDMLDNQLFIVGNAGSGPKSDFTKSAIYDRYDTRHIWTRSVKATEFQSNASFANAGVIEVDQQGAISIDSFLSSFDTFYHFNGGNFRIMVKNFGGLIVDKVDVLIGFELSTHSGCYFRPSKRIQFTNLNLAPGASTWVDFGDIAAIYQDTIPAQFCFWTAAPNELPDADHNDDTYCLDFQTTAAVEPPRSDVQAYPNPASDGIWIQTGAGVRLPEHYALFDMLGREVLQGSVPKGTDKYFISMAGQNEGFFILKTGTFVQKIRIKR